MSESESKPASWARLAKSRVWSHVAPRVGGRTTPISMNPKLLRVGGPHLSGRAGAGADRLQGPAGLLSPRHPPGPSMHHLGQGTVAAPDRSRGTVVGRGMPDGDGADGLISRRDVELAAQSVGVADSEEHRAQTLVDRGEEDEHGRERSVNQPVGDGPARLVLVRPTLVGLGVAIQI